MCKRITFAYCCGFFLFAEDSRRFLNVAQDRFVYISVHVAQTTSISDLSDRIRIHTQCILEAFTPVLRCPIAIRSPKTHVNARGKQGLILLVVNCGYSLIQDTGRVRSILV